MAVNPKFTLEFSLIGATFCGVDNYVSSAGACSRFFFEAGGSANASPRTSPLKSSIYEMLICKSFPLISIRNAEGVPPLPEQSGLRYIGRLLNAPQHL
jgi:hypothetical protein